MVQLCDLLLLDLARSKGVHQMADFLEGVAIRKEGRF